MRSALVSECLQRMPNNCNILGSLQAEVIPFLFPLVLCLFTMNCLIKAKCPPKESNSISCSYIVCEISGAGWHWTETELRSMNSSLAYESGFSGYFRMWDRGLSRHLWGILIRLHFFVICLCIDWFTVFTGFNIVRNLTCFKKLLLLSSTAGVWRELLHACVHLWVWVYWWLRVGVRANSPSGRLYQTLINSGSKSQRGLQPLCL